MGRAAKASASKDISFDDFAVNGQFAWFTTSGKACPGPAGGCKSRDGSTDTLARWERRGLPRTGWSYCAGYCYCFLMPMIGFGLDLAEELQRDDVRGLDPENGPRPQRETGRTYTGTEGLDVEDFRQELEDMPLVGDLANQVGDLLQRFNEGKIDYEKAKAEADQLLGLIKAGA